MQVRHRFPGMRPIVEDQPESGLVHAQLLRDLGGLEQQMAQDLVILWFRFGDARNHSFRNDEDMYRRKPRA